MTSKKLRQKLKARTIKSDESIFKSKEANEKPCRIDEASMEKDEGAEVRR